MHAIRVAPARINAKFFRSCSRIFLRSVGFEMDAIAHFARTLRVNHDVAEVGDETEVFAFARRDRAGQIGT